MRIQPYQRQIQASLGIIELLFELIKDNEIGRTNKAKGTERLIEPYSYYLNYFKNIRYREINEELSRDLINLVVELA